MIRGYKRQRALGRLHSRDVICVTLGGVRICQENEGDKEKEFQIEGTACAKAQEEEKLAI